MAEIKVFCTQCGYFNSCKKGACNSQFDEEDIHEQCHAPDNIRATYMSDGSDKFISVPSIINRYNNCKWFVPKGQAIDLHHLIRKHNMDPEAHPKIQKDVSDLNLKVNEIDQRARYLINQHTQDLDNPHQVSKSQLGLERVDNTPDLEKPVSVPVQTQVNRLDKKIDDSIGTHAQDIAELRTDISVLNNKVNINKTESITRDSELSVKLDAETDRAVYQENELRDKITNLSTKLNSEVTTLTNVDISLQNQISTLSTTVVSHGAEISALGNSINAEVSRATTKEQDLTNKIQAEVTRAQAEEATIKQNIVNCETTCKAYTDTSVSTFNQRLDNTNIRIEEVSSTLNTKVDLVNTRINNLDTETVAEPAKVVTDVYQTDGLIHVNTDYVTKDNVSGLNEALNQKANTSDVQTKVAELTGLISAGDTATLTNSKQYTDTQLNQHKIDTSNPHQVTKAQVGLSNVDNTADIDKPISNATKNYVDSQDDAHLTDAVTQAKHYSDDKLVEAKTYTDHVAEDTKEYTDNLVSTTKTELQNNIDSLKTEEDTKITNLTAVVDTKATTTYVDNQDNLSLASSKSYTNTKISEVEAKLVGAIHYKGQVEYYSDLETIAVKQNGDMYNVLKRDDGSPDGNNYVWNAEQSTWDKMAGYVDLSNYYKKAEVDTNIGIAKDSAINTAKNYTDAGLSDKADKSDTYTKQEVTDKDTAILTESKAFTTETTDVISGSLASHVTDYNNPHQVTKAQVGLGNVDNTTDLAKPISTATQDALNLKADKAVTLEGYGIANAYNKTDANSKIASAISEEDRLIKILIDEKDSAVRTDLGNNITSTAATLRTEIASAKTDAISSAKSTAESLDKTVLAEAKADAVVKDTEVRSDLRTEFSTNIENLKTNYIDTKDAATLAAAGIDTNNKIADLKVSYIDTAISAAKQELNQTISNHTSKTTGNPHNVTAADIGLENVNNTADLAKPISTATQTALNNKADKADTLLGYGITNAYDKTQTEEKISGGVADAVSEADGHTDSKIAIVKESLLNSISNAKNEAIAVAETKDTEVLEAAKTYTNQQIVVAKSYTDTAKNEAISTASGDATTKSNNAKTEAVSDAKTYTDQQISVIEGKISSSIHYRGSVTYYSDLEAITNKQHGDMYNVLKNVDDTPNGNNYVWIVKDSGSGFWDKMAGSVDLSAYWTGSYTQGKLDALDAKINTKVTQDDVNASIVNKADKATTLSGYGITDAASLSNLATTKTELEATISSSGAALKTDITAEYTQLVDTTKQDLITKITTDDTATYNSAVSKAGELDTIVLATAESTATNLVTAAETRITTAYTGEIANAINTCKNDAAAKVKAHTDIVSGNPHHVTKSDVGLGNVDNTSDLAKPISTLTQAALDNKYNKSETYSKGETDGKLADKANVADVYDKDTADSRIQSAANTAEANAKSYAHSEDDALETRAATTAHGYADTAKSEAIESANAYTDEQIARIRDKHYAIKKVDPDETYTSNYIVADYSTNNIDLTGITGDIYIYMPLKTASLAGKAREFIINVSNRNVNNCTIHFAGQPDETTIFRDAGVLDTLSTKKSEFSIKFQEFDTYKFAVDEIGVGDTTNNDKIQITSEQVTLKDNLGDSYKLIVEDGQLKIKKILPA